MQVQHQKRRSSARGPIKLCTIPSWNPFWYLTFGQGLLWESIIRSPVWSLYLSVLGGYLILGFRVLPSVLGFGENLRIQEPPVFRVFENFQRSDGFHETQEHVELVHKVLTVGTNFWMNLEVIQNHHFLPSFFFSFVFKPYSSNYFRN